MVPLMKGSDYMFVKTVRGTNPQNIEDDLGSISLENDGYLMFQSDIKGNAVVSLYVKGNGSITLGDESFQTDNNWTRFAFKTIVDIGDYVKIKFTQGTYLIYEAQLEVGTVPTDWHESEEETQEKIDAVDEKADNLDEKLEELTTIEDGKTVIDGGKIKTNSILAKSIIVDDAFVSSIFAKDITATGTITGATLKGADAEVTNGRVGGFTLNKGSLDGIQTTEHPEYDMDEFNVGVGYNYSKSNYGYTKMLPRRFEIQESYGTGDGNYTENVMIFDRHSLDFNEYITRDGKTTSNETSIIFPKPNGEYEVGLAGYNVAYKPSISSEVIANKPNVASNTTTNICSITLRSVGIYMILGGVDFTAANGGGDRYMIITDVQDTDSISMNRSNGIKVQASNNGHCVLSRMIIVEKTDDEPRDYYLHARHISNSTQTISGSLRYVRLL